MISGEEENPCIGAFVYRLKKMAEDGYSNVETVFDHGYPPKSFHGWIGFHYSPAPISAPLCSFSLQARAVA